MAKDKYRVVADQINRVTKVDGEEEFSSLRRGAEFTADDVTEKELKRWLGIKPAPVRLVADIEKESAATSDAAATIADLQAQLAEANAKLAAVDGGGGTQPVTEPAPGQTGGTLEEPAGNASKKDWQAYALQQHPEDADSINADPGPTRDELAKKYGTKS